MQKLICPSILAADFSCLGDEVRTVLKAGADTIHFDVMDNHYVPNLTVGPLVCESLRKAGITATIDVHLMIKPVDALIVAFADAGADYISFHPDASEDVGRSLALVRSKGCRCGLAISPNVSLQAVDAFLDELDLLLMMLVQPGFGGQKLMPETVDKVRRANDLLHGRQQEVMLQADGGITLENIAMVSEAGANAFVAGTAIFSTTDYARTIAEMRRRINTV